MVILHCINNITKFNVLLIKGIKNYIKMFFLILYCICYQLVLIFQWRLFPKSKGSY